MRSHLGFSLGIILLIVLPISASAEEHFYHLEVGMQAGAGYYMGELAPYAFMSTAETYGLQARCKIDRRWALQVKGQRQRVVNSVKMGNDWNINPGKYQVPMWHFDISGEFNFFRFGWDAYDIRVKNVTPYISVGIGMTVHNVAATRQKNEKNAYPALEIKNENRLEYAMYVPVSVGIKWAFADRWQLQVAWQHNLYMLNGDGLEGMITAVKSKDNKQDMWLNDSHNMNGSNVMNNDVTSTLTLAVTYAFAARKKTCTYCLY